MTFSFPSLGLVSHLFLLPKAHWFLPVFRSDQFPGPSSTGLPGLWTRCGYFWQCRQVPGPTGKWSLHLHKAGQQEEAGRAPKSPSMLWWAWPWWKPVHQHQQVMWLLKPNCSSDPSCSPQLANLLFNGFSWSSCHPLRPPPHHHHHQWLSSGQLSSLLWMCGLPISCSPVIFLFSQGGLNTYTWNTWNTPVCLHCRWRMCFPCPME